MTTQTLASVATCDTFFRCLSPIDLKARNFTIDDTKPKTDETKINNLRKLLERDGFSVLEIKRCNPLEVTSRSSDLFRHDIHGERASATLILSTEKENIYNMANRLFEDRR